jgi:protein-tyrosine phosphatase
VNGVFWINSHPSVSLAIVLCPSGSRSLHRELQSMQRGGVETLVSMLEVDEAHWLGLADEGRLAQQLGLEYLSHPIPDHHTPPDPHVFRAFVTGLAARLRAGERIGVHCWGSIGRATVTAACTLIHLGWKPAAALAAVESARGCPVPDTEEQERWILAYEAAP